MERFSATLGSTAGRDLGPLRLEGRVEGRQIGWANATPWQEGRAVGKALVPFWGTLGSMTHLVDVGVEMGLGAVQGTPDVRIPDDVASEAWRVGPVVSSVWLSSNGVPISVDVSVPQTAQGLRPNARARMDVGSFAFTGAVDEIISEGRFRWDSSVSSVAVGAVQMDDLFQGRASVGQWLPGPLQEWHVGWAGLLDLNALLPLSQGPSLRFKSKCNCLSVYSAAQWSVDQDRPEVVLRVDVTP